MVNLDDVRLIGSHVPETMTMQIEEPRARDSEVIYMSAYIHNLSSITPITVSFHIDVIMVLIIP